RGTAGRHGVAWSDRPRRVLQPGAGGLVDLWLDDLAHPGVVGVQPRLLRSGHQSEVDAADVDRRQGQGLELEILAVSALDLRFLHRHQILDTDAVGAGLVVAGLVADDHAGLQRHGARDLGNAVRAFV